MKVYNAELFDLEGGGVLPGGEIEYTTYGTLSPKKDNVIWVCHALTADSRVADWWPHTVEEGRFLDPSKWFVVCANFLGSPYGTSSPVTTHPNEYQDEEEHLWGHEFPMITVRDMVRYHQMLAKELGIDHVELLIGSSIGGFQVMEWAIMEPGFAKRIALIGMGYRLQRVAANGHRGRPDFPHRRSRCRRGRYGGGSLDCTTQLPRS